MKRARTEETPSKIQSPEDQPPPAKRARLELPLITNIVNAISLGQKAWNYFANSIFSKTQSTIKVAEISAIKEENTHQQTTTSSEKVCGETSNQFLVKDSESVTVNDEEESEGTSDYVEDLVGKFSTPPFSKTLISSPFSEIIFTEQFTMKEYAPNFYKLRLKKLGDRNFCDAIKKIPLFRKGMDDLLSYRDVNCDLISDYFRRYEREYSNIAGLDSGYAHDESFINKLVESPTYMRRTRAKLIKSDYIFWPICTEAEIGHWFLVILEKKTDGYHIYCLDGFNSNLRIAYLEKGKELLKALYNGQALNIEEHKIDIPNQGRTLDCGPVICFWSLYIAMTQSLSLKDNNFLHFKCNYADFRFEIAEVLLQATQQLHASKISALEEKTPSELVIPSGPKPSEQTSNQFLEKHSGAVAVNVEELEEEESEEALDCIEGNSGNILAKSSMLNFSKH